MRSRFRKPLMACSPALEGFPFIVGGLEARSYGCLSLPSLPFVSYAQMGVEQARVTVRRQRLLRGPSGRCANTPEPTLTVAPP